MRYRIAFYVVIILVPGCASGTRKLVGTASNSNKGIEAIVSVDGNPKQSMQKPYLTAASPESLATGYGSIINDAESDITPGLDQSSLAARAKHSDAQFYFLSGDGTNVFYIFGPKGETRLKFACRSNIYYESPSGKYVLILDPNGAYVFESDSGKPVALELVEGWRPEGWWNAGAAEDTLYVDKNKKEIGACHLNGKILWSMSCENCSGGLSLSSPSGNLKLVSSNRDNRLIDFRGNVLGRRRIELLLKRNNETLSVQAVTDDGDLVYRRMNKSYLVIGSNEKELEVPALSFWPSDVTSFRSHDGKIVLRFYDSKSKSSVEFKLTWD